MNKTKWIFLGIGIVAVVAVMVFCKLVPFWISMIALGSFIFGRVSIYYLKRWYNKNCFISGEPITGNLLDESPEWGSLDGYIPAGHIEEKQTDCTDNNKEN